MGKTLGLADATVSDTVSGAGTTDYRYYADGTRAEKIAPGNLTRQFYYMGGRRLAVECDAPRARRARKGDRPPAASARTESPDGLEDQNNLPAGLGG